MDLRAVRAVHDEAPVAELVAEPLDDDGAVVGHVAGGRALLVEVGEQVVGGPGVEAGSHDPGARRLGVEGAKLADEGAHALAELGWPAEGVALPERQPAGLSGGGRDQDPVVGDVLDAPGGRAEREDVADAGLVDHLLVELADPGLLLADEEDAEQPAVGDGAAAGDREPLGAWARGQLAGDAVPDDAGAELGEGVAGVATGEHVEDRVVGALRQRGERRGSSDEREQVVDVPRVDSQHGHDLLGEDVEGVARHVQRLDLPGAHAFGDDGGLDEVAAVLREDHALADGPDLVAGAADALQPAGHRRR